MAGFRVPWKMRGRRAMRPFGVRVALAGVLSASDGGAAHRGAWWARLNHGRSLDTGRGRCGRRGRRAGDHPDPGRSSGGGCRRCAGAQGARRGAKGRWSRPIWQCRLRAWQVRRAGPLAGAAGLLSGEGQGASRRMEHHAHKRQRGMPCPDAVMPGAGGRAVRQDGSGRIGVPGPSPARCDGAEWAAPGHGSSPAGARGMPGRGAPAVAGSRGPRQRRSSLVRRVRPILLRS